MLYGMYIVSLGFSKALFANGTFSLNIKKLRRIVWPKNKQVAPLMSLVHVSRAISVFPSVYGLLYPQFTFKCPEACSPRLKIN